MLKLATDVHQLAGRPSNAINVYLVGDVLVDAGTPGAKKRILRELEGREVGTHVVTHAHPDHYGSSHAVCEALGLPLWTGAHDADAIETSTPEVGASRVAPLLRKLKPPPAHPVARRLVEGDAVADFVVLDAPGHSRGQIVLWRERDGTLIAGDVFFNIRKPGPPPDFLTVDPALNRESMRRLAALRPALVLFGHGAPLRDPGALARAAS